MQKEFFRKHWFEIALAVVVMAVHVYAATSDAINFPSSWFTRDDAYYYFKVAQNITEGHGITFDGIDVTNGYHPLWMLVNIPIFALARFDLVLPLRILLLLQGALSAGTALLIYRIARAAISEPVAVFAASWWAFDAYIHAAMYEFGLETALASFMAALLIYRLFLFESRWRKAPTSLRQVIGLAAVAALAMLSRLDLVFLAGLAGLWIILRGTTLRYLLPLDMLLAVCAVLASFVFRLGLPDYYNYARAAIIMAAISAWSKLVLYYLYGLYQPISQKPFLLTARQIAVTVSLSTLLTGALMLAGSFLTGGFPRTVLLIDWSFNLVGMLVLRGLWTLLTQKTNTGTSSPLQLLQDHWRAWLREGAAFYAMLGLPLAAYMLFNKLVIGTAMPISGQIKRWWGQAGSLAYGGPARSPLAFWSADAGSEFNAWNPLSGWLGNLSLKIAEWRGAYRNDEIYIGLLIAACLLWLLVLALKRRQAVRAAMLAGLPLLFTASITQVLSYNALGYASMKEWYWISEPLFLVFALGFAARVLLDPLQKLWPGRVFLLLAAGLAGLWMAWSFAWPVGLRMPHGAHPDAPPTMDIVVFLEQNTPPGSIIGMTGGGNVGYYISGRTIVNMDGLINSPAYFEALKDRAGSQYLQAIEMDYIFANPTILEGMPYYGQFKTGAELGRFGGKALMEFTP